MPHEKRLRPVDVYSNKKATTARFTGRFGRYFPHQICHCQTGAFRAGVSGLMPYQITQTRLAKASFCKTAALSCQLLNTGGSQSPEPSAQSFQAASSQSRQNCTATPCASLVKARVLSVAFPTPHPNFLASATGIRVSALLRTSTAATKHHRHHSLPYFVKNKKKW